MSLTVNGLSKKYGEKTVVDNLSFEIKEPGVYALLGTNGAGKTTSIRMILGMLASNSGEVLWKGEPLDAVKCNVGYLAEERGLYPKYTLMDQLVYFARLRGVSKSDALDRIKYWSDRFEVNEYIYPEKNAKGKKIPMKKPEQLSKGNQQKIQLVTALAHDPDIVILDEPFSGLDPVNAMMLKEIVRELIAEGKIVLFSSHQMSYIEEFCDSIAIINAGKVAISGDLFDIKRNYVRDKLVVSTTAPDAIRADLGDACSDGDKGELIIKLKSPDLKKDMMRHIIEKYDVDEIKVFEPSLNDIFVEYAGNQI